MPMKVREVWSQCREMTVRNSRRVPRRNFQDALTSHFEIMREIGEPIPEPRVSVDYVEVVA